MKSGVSYPYYILYDNIMYGLEGNADKTKYMVMSRDWNAGRACIVKLIIVPLRGWKSSNIWERH